MTSKKFGSLFDQLRAKSPEKADKLKNIQKGKSQNSSSAKTAPIESKGVKVKKDKKSGKQAQREVLVGKGWVTTSRGAKRYLCEGCSPIKIEADFLKASEGGKRIIRGSIGSYYRKLLKQNNQNYSQQNLLVRLHNLIGMMDKDLLGEMKKKIPRKMPLQKAVVSVNRTSKKSEKSEQITRSGNSQKTAQYFSSELQFSSGGNGRTCDAIIGLDFGTSCTKVVVQTPYEKELAFAVQFGPFAHPTCQHFLPTHLSCSEDGEYFVPQQGKFGQFRDLKIGLIEILSRNESQASDELLPTTEHAIAYLALVFRYVRTWFIREKEQIYGELNLRWQANIGIPSKSFDSEQINQLYRQVSCCAWLVSIEITPITKESINVYWDVCKKHNGDCSNCRNRSLEMEIFPELAGEVTGYACSEFREEGLHLMVDVGAGTLDVCGFVLHSSDGEDLYPLLTSDVQHLGAAKLNQIRQAAILDSVKDSLLSVSGNGDPVAPISKDPQEYVPDVDKAKSELNRVEREYSSKCSNQIRNVIRALKNRRDPLSRKWDGQLPVFLCGGGSDLPVINRVVNDVSIWLKEFSIKCEGGKLIKLEKPENLSADISPRDYHRLAVACGLSRPAVEIGRCIPAGEIEDIVLPSEDKGTSNWWEREDVYPGQEQM